MGALGQRHAALRQRRGSATAMPWRHCCAMAVSHSGYSGYRSGVDLDGDIEVNDDRQHQEDNAAHSDLTHGIED